MSVNLKQKQYQIEDKFVKVWFNWYYTFAIFYSNVFNFVSFLLYYFLLLSSSYVINKSSINHTKKFNIILLLVMQDFLQA